MRKYNGVWHIACGPERVCFKLKILCISKLLILFFFQAEDGIRDWSVTGVQTCALPISSRRRHTRLVSDWSSDVCSSDRSEEHTSELQSLTNSYAVFCLRSEEHTSELQSLTNLVCRLLLEKKKEKGEEGISGVTIAFHLSKSSCDVKETPSSCFLTSFVPCSFFF